MDDAPTLRPALWTRPNGEVSSVMAGPAQWARHQAVVLGNGEPPIAAPDAFVRYISPSDHRSVRDGEADAHRLWRLREDVVAGLRHLRVAAPAVAPSLDAAIVAAAAALADIDAVRAAAGSAHERTKAALFANGTPP